jgi:putative hydrolase of the HAD superfamily
MITSLIFDLFDTLVDFSLEEYNRMLERMCECLSVEKEAFISTWHESWPQYEVGKFKNAFEYIQYVSNGSYNASGLIAAEALHCEYEKDILNPRDGVAEVLGHLRDRGYKIGIVTNCAVETPHFWPQTPFSKLVDSAVFSSLEMIRKPNPEMFKVCIERLQSKPSECLFVGDGANDELDAAQLAGVVPVLLDNHDHSSASRLKNWNGLVIDDLSNIERIVKKAETLQSIAQRRGEPRA